MVEVTLNNQRRHDLHTADTTHRIRFYNETGVEIRFRCVGVYETANFVADLDVDESFEVPRLNGGERLVVTWDDLHLKLIDIKRVNFTRDGRIRIKRTIQYSQHTNAPAILVENAGATLPVGLEVAEEPEPF